MKNIHILIGVLVVLSVVNSCDPIEVEANFEDMIDMTIYNYVTENQETYSSFLRIMEEGKIDKTLGAYNPDGLGYTLFLPTNDAVDEFIQHSDQFSSLEELLADQEYVSLLGRYHTVNMALKSDDFPFGALPSETLSEDILTVSFIVEPDTSYFSINNQAPVIETNVELSNGYIHVISSALEPVALSTYGWLERHPGFSIFLSAVEATGLVEDFDIDTKENEEVRPFTLLLEHDSIFNRRGIQSFEDLAADISPDDEDYSNPLNPLQNFVKYHMLNETQFLNDFEGKATNYSTHSDIPLNINGLGLDIVVNSGKQVFDTIISGTDTTIVDYIGFNYDQSNLLTKSGSIHFIGQILRQVQPSRAIQTFQFYEEPLFNKFRLEPAEYLVEDSSALFHIKWSGSDLFFVQDAEQDHPAWGSDYLLLGGDFSITYEVPQLVQGSYMVYLRAESFNKLNALVEVFIDGKKLGGLIDLTTGGSSQNPFQQIELGTINFVKYERHTVQVRSLIPGLFLWDYVRFEPN